MDIQQDTAFVSIIHLMKDVLRGKEQELLEASLPIDLNKVLTPEQADKVLDFMTKKADMEILRRRIAEYEGLVRFTVEGPPLVGKDLQQALKMAGVPASPIEALLNRIGTFLDLIQDEVAYAEFTQPKEPEEWDPFRAARSLTRGEFLIKKAAIQDILSLVKKLREEYLVGADSTT